MTHSIHKPNVRRDEGSTSITVNDAGQRTAQVWYKPLRCTQGRLWGEVREVWGVLPTDRTFQGQLDFGLGLLNFKARWFDPLLGRFAQADIVIPNAGNPIAWDRYAGFGNNPVLFTDPSGNKPCDEQDENGNCIAEPGWANIAFDKPSYIDPDSMVGRSRMQEVYDIYLRMWNNKRGWWWNINTFGGGSH